MTVEIQNNKYDNTLMKSVVAIWKQERGVTKKVLQRENPGIQGGLFVKRMTAIYKKIVPSTKPVTRERNIKNLSLQATILYSKENYFMWCKVYDKN